MVKNHKKIKWDKSATNNFNSAISYIREDSIKNANRVKENLLEKINNIKDNPEKYPADKYKLDNDGTYRAFEQHHLRVIYRVQQAEIKIITVRHTKMKPLEY
jgi:plasmid stabilization system protein ParE